jgi:hypothetical protein
MKQTLFAVAPPWFSDGQCTLLCLQGGEAGRHPCHSTAHCQCMKRQPSLVSVAMTTTSSSLSLWPLPLPLPSLLPLPLPLVNAVSIAVGCRRCRYRHRRHCHCSHHRHRSSLLQLPSAIAIAVAITVTISIAISVGRCHCHCHVKHHLPCKRRRPSLESCCLGAVTIIFKQFKQIMLTLFYFAWTVRGTLIAADDWLGVERPWVLASTSIGRQAASSKRLVGASG